jgi:hypothetical protein
MHARRKWGKFKESVCIARGNLWIMLILVPRTAQRQKTEQWNSHTKNISLPFFMFFIFRQIKWNEKVSVFHTFSCALQTSSSTSKLLFYKFSFLLLFVFYCCWCRSYSFLFLHFNNESDKYFLLFRVVVRYF